MLLNDSILVINTKGPASKDIPYQLSTKMRDIVNSLFLCLNVMSTSNSIGIAMLYHCGTF